MCSVVTRQPATVSFRGPEVEVWSSKRTVEVVSRDIIFNGQGEGEYVCVCVCVCVFVDYMSVFHDGAVCEGKEQTDEAEREMHFSNVTLPCHTLRREKEWCEYTNLEEIA